ncbi:hypothetical protein [Pseudobacillus badius]|nr:hypothetical protein [Bacillus badius]
MKVCEVCGQEETLESSEDQWQASRLHICESCRTDRQSPSTGDE